MAKGRRVAGERRVEVGPDPVQVLQSGADLPDAGLLPRHRIQKGGELAARRHGIREPGEFPCELLPLLDECDSLTVEWPLRPAWYRFVPLAARPS